MSATAHYTAELEHLRNLAQDFARTHPALAPMLLGESADPDVERLLEGVAFLIALVRQRLDDDAPEFTQGLAALLFPQQLRPLPATTLVAFAPRGVLETTQCVAAGTELATRPIDGTRCVFRTTHALDVHPLHLRSSSLQQDGGPALRLEFDMAPTAVPAWRPAALRLFLGGGAAAGAQLLLLLTRHLRGLRLCADHHVLELGTSALRPSGFDAPMLPATDHAFPGYALLQDYFLLPEKFLFVNIALPPLPMAARRGFTLLLNLEPPPGPLPDIGADSFMLHVAPAVNLFEHAAAPIRYDHRSSEYPVLPDGNASHHQVYAIERVTGLAPGTAHETVYAPFGMHEALAPCYRTSLRADPLGGGSQLLLSLLHPPGTTPAAQTLSLQLTCCNRALPQRLRVGDISEATRNSPERLSFTNIRVPTPTRDAPTSSSRLWRLMSHAALNLRSLGSVEALRDLLALQLADDDAAAAQMLANRRRIAALDTLELTPETHLFGPGGALRGMAIVLRGRADQFAGIADFHLFGCLLEQFFADYVGLNCYTRFELHDTRSATVFTWPPRLGRQALI